MAGRIAGITIEIGGDTTKLQSALKGVDKTLKTTQANLKDINKLLKMDPGNTELLVQKQKNLETAIKATKDRLNELKNAQSQVKQGSAEWDALQREIIATEQELKGLENEYKEFGSVAKQQTIAAGQQMKDLGGKIQDVGRKFAPVSAAAAGLLTGLGTIGYQAVTTADDLNTLAKQSGFTTEEIQKMKYASDMIDVSFEDISGALRKMKPKMNESNAAFKQLGISVTDSKGHLRSATEVFYESVEALSHIKNETERDQMAMTLFGKSADQLAGIIDDGGKALKAYGDEAERLGLILDQETLDKINEVNDRLDESKAKWNAAKLELGAVVAEALAPLISNLALIVEKLAQWMAKLSPEQARLIIIIAAVVAAIAPLLMIIGGLVSAIGTITAALAGVSLPILGLIALIPLLIAAGVWLITHWDEVKEKAEELWAKVKDEWNKGINTVKAVTRQFIDTTVRNWNELKTKTVNKWNEIKTSVKNSISNMISSAMASFNNFKSSVSAVFDSVRSSIVSKLESAKQSVQNIFDQIKHVFDTVLTIKIKVPHIHVSGGQAPWGIGGKGTPPSFDVEWYKRAYDNPVMFTSPTVLGTPAGMKGFGDGAGAEIVLGMNKLRELVGSNTGTVVINVYPAEGMNINQLADKIQDRFVQLQKQRSAAYA